jgi:hypothetical protein
LRGYYPGEREYRERPKPRVKRPRLDQPLPLPTPRRPAKRTRPARQARPARRQPAPLGPPSVGLPAPARRERARERAPGRSRRLDWVFGILLGILLGLAIVTAFLVLGSEDTIDAPSVDGAPPVREAPPATPSGE